jgi:hypothetical protein
MTLQTDKTNSSNSSNQTNLAKFTNNFTHGMSLQQLHVHQATVFSPFSAKDWIFSHQPHITSFKGKLYAIWSNSKVNEDDVGQRVMLSTSSDFFHWTVPIPLANTRMGNDSELVLSAMGFHIYDDTLTAYVSEFECNNGDFKDYDNRLHMGLSVYTTTDGLHWEGPTSLDLPSNPNHGPQRTSSGRLIIAGHILFPYTDDPAGLQDWKLAGVYPLELEAGLVDCFHTAQQQFKALNQPILCSEGSLHETDDGILHMILRTPNRMLAVSDSSDDGLTWSAPVETNFTDNNSRFHFGKLPDGRYYYVGNPDPDPSYKRRRLVLSLSEDGYMFDRHYELIGGEQEVKFPGTHKAGAYAYPHTVIHEGSLVIIHSLCKENIGVLQVPLDQLI